jgi:hypothetical protein
MTENRDPEKSSYEKLRDELFDTRVDLKAWIRSLKVLGSSVVVLLTILGYFGYNKIESIESTILDKANARLAKTDTILSKIDEKKIDELNRRLGEKQREYEITLSNFEKVLRKNKELEEKLLRSLPPNERAEHPLREWYEKSPEDYFEVRPFGAIFRRKEKQDIYLTFAEKFDLKKASVLRLQLIEDKKNGYQVIDYFFKVQQRFNKITFTPDVDPGNYVLNVGFVTTENNKDTFFRNQNKVKVQ